MQCQLTAERRLVLLVRSFTALTPVWAGTNQEFMMARPCEFAGFNRCVLRSLGRARLATPGGAASSCARAAVRRLWEGIQHTHCTNIHSRTRACGVRPRIVVQQ